MTKNKLDAICMSLLCVLAVACGDAGNAGFEDDPDVVGQDEDNGFGGAGGMAGAGGTVGAGGMAGTAGIGENLIAPPDDEVDPYHLTVVFDDGEESVADVVSYSLGDTQDVVFYSVDRRFALGQLEIRAFCDGEGVDNIEFLHSLGGETFNCDPTGVLVVDRLVGPDIPGSGSVTITAVGGEDTLVTWILEGSVTPR